MILIDLLAALVGGVLWTALLTAVIKRFAFKSLPPIKRIAANVSSAWLAIYFSAGYLSADAPGEVFLWSAGLKYTPGAVIVFLIEQARYKKSLGSQRDADG